MNWITRSVRPYSGVSVRIRAHPALVPGCRPDQHLREDVRVLGFLIDVEEIDVVAHQSVLALRVRPELDRSIASLDVAAAHLADVHGPERVRRAGHRLVALDVLGRDQAAGEGGSVLAAQQRLLQQVARLLARVPQAPISGAWLNVWPSQSADSRPGRGSHRCRSR